MQMYTNESIYKAISLKLKVHEIIMQMTQSEVVRYDGWWLYARNMGGGQSKGGTDGPP